MGPFSILPRETFRMLALARNPLVIDVRRKPAFEEAACYLPSAIWRDHGTVGDWASPCGSRQVLVYCTHGHNVSQLAVAELRERGIDASMLEGGIEAWRAQGHPVVAKSPFVDISSPAGTLWITRRRPKIDRIACPWFIRRFVDPRARFHFVEPDQVAAVAEERDAVAFDTEEASFTHSGPRCSFDAMLDHFCPDDETLRLLGDIVRGADTASFDQARQSSGLLAVALGISAMCEDDDHAALRRGLDVYDSLYAWACLARGETHRWAGAVR